MVKMIVMDLDCSLFRDDKSISDFTLKTLSKYQSNGFKVAYATARGSSVKVMLPDYNFSGYVLMNGAAAFNGDSYVYKKRVSMDIARDILLKSSSYGLKTAAVTGDKHFADFDVNKEWGNIKNYEIVDFSNLEEDVEKLYMVVSGNEDVKFLESLIPEGLYMTVSRDNLAQIMNEEATKFKAISKLADFWNIDVSEVVAFGDDLNDLDMLKNCGVGVAMENALDEVKKVADYICGSNENDGIANWLIENIDLEGNFLI
ncbi:Cof-type HAD-IIB family hydrolase [Miniphocaeibacter massiliensis]|uniref:Cof-type HAD-IIB family hydrolase n=1 Tax=Miniphocaeibacter massiliensis TaxID=2041841 RepID=UPI0013EBC331|nr:Cof-type HAD-IIB family hydrolase [Miniphocaeibacter massiliensis]